MDESTVSSGPETISVDVESIEKELAPVGVIKSTTHGRIRMQLRPEYRMPEMMAQIKAQLEKDERVQEVTINGRTGSVTVKYASEHSGHGLLWKAMQEAELVGEAAFELPEDEEEPGEGKVGGGGGESTYGKLDGQVASVIYKFDLAVFRRTRGKIHLRGRVVPLALAGLGVAQIAIYGIGLELLPGPLLIWIAHDIHHRVAKEPPLTLTDTPASDASATEDTGASRIADSAGPLAGGAAPVAA